MVALVRARLAARAVSGSRLVTGFRFLWVSATDFGYRLCPTLGASDRGGFCLCSARFWSAGVHFLCGGLAR